MSKDKKAIIVTVAVVLVLLGGLYAVMKKQGAATPAVTMDPVADTGKPLQAPPASTEPNKGLPTDIPLDEAIRQERMGKYAKPRD